MRRTLPQITLGFALVLAGCGGENLMAPGPAGPDAFARAAGGVGGVAAASAPTRATIDFEQYAAGDRPGELATAGGHGPIGLRGDNPALGSADAAAIARVQRTGGSSLALVLAGDATEPTPELSPTGRLHLDFSGLGDGSVDVHSLVLADLLGLAFVQFFDANGMMVHQSFVLPTGLGHEAQLTLAPVQNVAAMVIEPGGPAYIDDIVLDLYGVEPPPGEPPFVPGDEGCGLGDWKNDDGLWAASGFARDDMLARLLPAAASHARLAGSSIDDALRLKGGPGVEGGQRLLARAAAAAMLNAQHPGIAYAMAPGAVADEVAAALASGDRPLMLELAARLQEANEAGCP